jgi:hypothetical protein
MATTCGKKARKHGGNKHSIKRSWRRSRIEGYRDGDHARQKQHREFVAGKVGAKE